MKHHDYPDPCSDLGWDYGHLHPSYPHESWAHLPSHHLCISSQLRYVYHAVPDPYFPTVPALSFSSTLPIRSLAAIRILRLPHGRFYVAKLVAAAFLGPRPSNKIIYHRNRNPADNTPANLLYVTRSEAALYGRLRRP